jgi:hypothetical protein
MRKTSARVSLADKAKALAGLLLAAESDQFGWDREIMALVQEITKGLLPIAGFTIRMTKPDGGVFYAGGRDLNGFLWNNEARLIREIWTKEEAETLARRIQSPNLVEVVPVYIFAGDD